MNATKNAVREQSPWATKADPWVWRTGCSLVFQGEFHVAVERFTDAIHRMADRREIYVTEDSPWLPVTLKSVILIAKNTWRFAYDCRVHAA